MHPSNKDQNFLETIEILNKNNVKYWICHGTLLGLIRDKQLIPWDHDIDIAVWSGTISREKIKRIMLSNNFLLKDKYVEDSSLTFEKKGGRCLQGNRKQYSFSFFFVSEKLEKMNDHPHMTGFSKTKKCFSNAKKNL